MKYLDEAMEDALLRPGEKGYDDAYTPVDFVIFIFIDRDQEDWTSTTPEIQKNHANAISELLKEGSVPSSGIQELCKMRLENLKRIQQMYQKHPNTYLPPKNMDLVETVLKLIDEHAETKRRHKAEQQLAFNKVLSERLGEASRAAEADGDVIRSISEALALLPEKGIPKWVPRAQSKKRKKSKKKKKKRR